MQTYQWAIKVTREDLDGEGLVERAYDETLRCGSEPEARARYGALIDHLKQGPNRHTPKYERIADVKLIRCPVGEWEVVA